MPELPRIIHVMRSGSAEPATHVVALTAGLAARRTEPFVVGPLDRRLRDELSRNGVRWANIPLPTTLGRGAQRTAARSLARLLGNLSPLLVHAHGFQAALTSQLALSRLTPRTPLVISPHGVPALRGHAALERMLRRFEYRRVLGACDAIIVASAAERKSLADLAGEGAPDDARVTVVAPGVERRRKSSVFDVGLKRRRAGLAQEAAVVVVVAPLEADVPLAEFLEAASGVSRELANVEFAVIGEGPRLAELEALAHGLGLSGNTVFPGRRPDALDIVGTCNVFVALSDEVGGVTLALEALARDVRVVAADLPGLREMFGDVAGVPVVPLSDREALAEAIRRQLESFSGEEDGIKASTDMAWGVSEVLASQDEFDLDKPGLNPLDRSYEAASDVERLLDSHTVEKMVRETLAVYGRVAGTAHG